MTDFDFIMSRVGNLSVSQMFVLSRVLSDRLKSQNIIRDGNSTVAGYAETLCCSAFDLAMKSQSNSGYDAICKKGIRYQTKARKLTSPKSSRQLGALRRLNSNPFDRLIGILFDENLNVVLAADIPLDVVRKRARFQQHTNSWIFHLHDDVWMEPGVKDVTGMVREAASKLENPDS